MISVGVDKGGLELAMKKLKRKVIKDGSLGQLKLRNKYPKRSEFKRAKEIKAASRRRKEAAKRLKAIEYSKKMRLKNGR